jgi:hypothetical protein
MLRLFLGNQIIGLILLPFIIAGYVTLNSYTNYFDVPLSFDMDLGLWGSHHFPNFFLVKYVAGIAVFGNALLLNFLFNTNTFYERNSYVVSILYVVLMSYYHSFYQIDGVLIAHFLVVLSFFQLFNLENNEDGRRISFNTGFLIGLAASFHPPLIFTLPLIWLMITRIRPLVFRELLLSTIGFLIPLIYGYSFVYGQKRAINWNILETAANYSQKQIIFLISMVLFSASAVLSMIGTRMKNSKSSIRFKKLTAIIYLNMVGGIVLGTVEIIKLGQYESFSVAMIALSLFLPFSFFYKSTNLFATILFYIIFMFSFGKFFI